MRLVAEDKTMPMAVAEDGHSLKDQADSQSRLLGQHRQITKLADSL